MSTNALQRFTPRGSRNKQEIIFTIRDCKKFRPQGGVGPYGGGVVWSEQRVAVTLPLFAFLIVGVHPWQAPQRIGAMTPGRFAPLQRFTGNKNPDYDYNKKQYYYKLNIPVGFCCVCGQMYETIRSATNYPQQKIPGAEGAKVKSQESEGRWRAARKSFTTASSPEYFPDSSLSLHVSQ